MTDKAPLCEWCRFIMSDAKACTTLKVLKWTLDEAWLQCQGRHFEPRPLWHAVRQLIEDKDGK